MSSYLPKSVQELIEEFEKLPGIGAKSAARMAYFFLRAPEDYAKRMSNAFLNLHSSITTCEECFNIAEKSPCDICSNPSRDSQKICIVEDPLDVVAFERAGGFDGLYFVLGGVISPAEGIGPEELRIEELISKIKKLSEKVDEEKQLELILATNPNMEGEATAVYITEYLTKNIKNLDKVVKITRLARGLPTGADLEYADSLTLKRALENRINF